MSYSQNSEEDVILDYFGNFKGHLLDIGANDGITLSNSREMIVRGWGGVLVEPSPTAFKKLKSLYLDHSKIDLLNVAIGATNGPAMFYESGSLLDRDDVALVSTMSAIEKQRWKHTRFTEIEVMCITPEGLVSQLETTMEFVSIDTESLDYFILCNLPFTEMGTRAVCVEFNGKEEQKYVDGMRPQGFQLMHKNGENLIFFHV